MKRAALVLVAVALAGCSNGGGDAGSPCMLMTTNNQVVDPGGVEGQAMTVVFPVGLVTTPECNKPLIDRAEATVFDPENQPVPNVVTLTSMKVNDARAMVSFTPPVFGVYHLAVRFEQSVASMQVDLQVAVDRSDAGFHTLVLASPFDCATFNVAAGVPLCHQLGSGALVAHLPNGGVDQIVSKRFSVDEAGRVWSLDDDDLDGGIRVLSVGPAGFTLLASASPGEFSSAMVARGDRAALIRRDTAEFWHFADGGLTLESSFTLPMSASQFSPAWCMTFAPPSHLLAVDTNGFNPPLLIDDGGVQMADTSAALLPEFTGADDNGAWWDDAIKLFAGQAERMNGTEVVWSAPMSGQVAFDRDCFESEQTPIFFVLQTVPRASAGRIVMEKFPSWPGRLFGANARVAWGIDGGVDGGTLFWWDR